MTTAIVYPPLSFPISPYLSMTMLAGQLKRNRIDVRCLDLNALFYSDICKKDVLKTSIKKAGEILKNKEPKKDFDSLSTEEKINRVKYLYTKSQMVKDRKLYKDTAENISLYLKILKSEKDFYNPEKFKKALMGVQSAIDLFFLPYSPAVSKPLNLRKPIFSYNYEDIKFQTTCKTINPYIEYYQEKLDNNFFKEYDLFFITVPFFEQLLPSLTLAKILKEKTDKKIILGGNYITRIKEAFINNPEIFDLYLDGVIICDGEDSIVDYSRYIRGEVDISEVSNLIYKNKENRVVVNDSKIYTEIEQRALQCFDGLDFSQYLAPEIEISIQTSKGCYWNKCSFCDYSFGKPIYSSYSVDKLINEFKYYKKNFGVRLFEIVDEALKPEFFEQVADRLIEENLNIKLYCFFRLEHSLTYELLKKFHKAGVVAVQWGYEAASERIMKLMNKGIDIKNRLNILKASSDAGIFNRVFGIACFPTETEEELLQTLDIFEKNKDIIHCAVIYKFVLGKHCFINKNQEKFSLHKINTNEEDFSAIEPVSSDNYTEIVKQKYSGFTKSIVNPFLLDIRPDEYLLYYLSHYTKNEILNMYKN